jgi:hypothetical protein
MSNVPTMKLSEFFHAKIKEIIMKKYPEECEGELTEEKFEELLIRLVHENDEILEWEKTSTYGGALDEHLEFQTGSQIEQSAQKMDKFLAGFAKRK